jgi:hypothetical protein
MAPVGPFAGRAGNASGSNITGDGGHSGATGNCPRDVFARAKQLCAGEHVCLGRP